MRFITLIVLFASAFANAQTAPPADIPDANTSFLIREDSDFATAYAISSNANAKAVAASAVVKADQNQLDALVQQVTAAFHQTPKYLAAKEGVDDTQKTYDAARAKVIDALHASADFQAAAAARDVAANAVNDARASGDPDAIASAAKTAMDARSALVKMEQLALDGNTGYKSAKAAMVAAQPALAAIEGVFEDSLPSDPKIKAIKMQLANDQALAQTAKQNAASALAAAQSAAEVARSRISAGPTRSGGIDASSLGNKGGL